MRRRGITGVALCITAIALLAPQARANVGHDYGFGSLSAGAAGSGTAWGFDAFASYYNPAALAADDRKLRLSFGILAMQPSFLPIQGVTIENGYVSDKPRTGDVDTDYRTTLGQVIGASVTFTDFLNLSAGATVFLPINAVAYMDTGEPFAPEYVLYRARTQRPQVNLGLGAKVAPRVHVGVGAYLGFALSANASVFLQTTETSPSTMRFATSMKPKMAPYAGVFIGGRGASVPVQDSEEGETTPGDDPGWSAGLVVRAPLTSPNTMVLNSGARAFGSFAALDFVFKSTSALYYDPLTVEGGVAARLGNRHLVSLQTEFQRWSKFEAPTLSIQEATTENCKEEDGYTDECGVKVTPSNNPSFNFRDIVVPRVGYEFMLTSSTALRAGYAFRPGIIKSVPNDAGNFLDPTKHIVTAGVGLNYQRLFGYDLPWRLDIHGAFHRLMTQTISKTAGDETGNSDGTKIGAPGYQAGGNIFGGGITVSFAF